MLPIKIMVAYDASSYSRKALDWILNEPRFQGCDINVVTVLPTANSFHVYESIPVAIADLIETRKEEISQGLDALKTDCAAKSKLINTHVLEGNAAHALLDYADAAGIQMIVTGTRGAGGFEGLLLGSVAQKLVTHAKVPVLVIK